MTKNKRLKPEYAEAVVMLTELKSKQYNVVKKVAEETGVNYHALRLHVYTYHRELIGLDPAKNKGNCVLALQPNTQRLSPCLRQNPNSRRTLSCTWRKSWG